MGLLLKSSSASAAQVSYEVNHNAAATLNCQKKKSFQPCRAHGIQPVLTFVVGSAFFHNG